MAKRALVLLTLLALLLAALPAAAQDGPDMITNGSFSNGENGWVAFYNINPAPHVVNGVANLYRTNATTPSATFWQDTNVAVPQYTIIEARFQMGNSSSQRKRVLAIMRSRNWQDMQACSFWIPANSQLQNYVMRSYSTLAWEFASLSFYPTSLPNEFTPAIQLDNVSMRARPSITIVGTECYEPGSSISAEMSAEDVLETETLLESLIPTLIPTGAPDFTPDEGDKDATPAPLPPVLLEPTLLPTATLIPELDPEG